IDDKCGRCDNNNSPDSSSLVLSPTCFGFLSTDETFSRVIMAMVGDKKMMFLHLHFFDNEGEIRLYLSDSKYLDIEEK
ncbi:8146_t:CDS:2, partial [Funneliformis geosporum]